MSSGNEEGEETSSYSKNTNSGAESLSDDEVWQPSSVDDEDSLPPSFRQQTPSKSINCTFYQRLRPRMLNLINEFADAEMFLIDGDSLFLELLLDNNLDWCYGGQFLHLIYLFEQYLHLFVRKGGVFQIVFFQDFRELWKSEPSLYLARLALKIHLCEHIDNKVLCEFKNPWDPKFAKYVEEFCPSFMLLSDDEIVGLSSRLSKLVSKIFVCQLLECLHLGLNCAFTAGIEFGTSTLNGYHVASEGYFQIWKLPNDKILDDLRSYNLKFQTDIRPSLVDLLSRLSNVSSPLAVECSDNEGRLDCRLFLHMAAASVYLKSFSNDTHKAKSHHDLVRVVLLHGVLLTELPLKYRAFSLDNCDIIQEHTVRQNLLHCFTRIQFIMSEILESLLMLPEASVLSWSKADISDIWDGRLLFVLLSVLLINKSSGKGVSLTERSRKKFVSLAHSVSLLSDERIEPFPILDFLGGNLDVELEGMFTFPPNQERTDVGSNEEWQPTSPSLLERQAPPELEKEGLIKMECPLLNNYVGEIVDTPSVIKLDENDPAVATLVMSGNDFDETYHWHSGKPLPDEYERTKETKFEGKDKRATMRKQDKYALHMRIYGESLEGEMNSKPIVVENAGRRGKKDKASHSKKSQRIIEENIRKKAEETAMKDKRLWENEKKLLQHLVNQERYDEALGKVANVLERVSAEEIIIDGLMMKTMICWKKWQLVCDKKDADSSEAQNCFLVIRELLENYANDLKHKDKVSLGEFLVGLGFSDIALKMNLIKSSLPSGEYSLNVSSSRFQLHSIGHQLRRDTRTDPDSRVDNFIPETWQRKLLDAVDNKQSALIVAPTSSGKTFASYYCMERVLKEDNDGVVVYVSPTKALVNQVAATCHARYHRKIMPAGKSVCGVFTRDYRHNALNSQILVTVPQCLEILLLSPGRQDWTAKIKYVVFDEVHCLGSEIGAEYWEHLLLLIRSPFLALSATIRNPDDLHKWLQSAEYGKRERDVMNRTVRPNPKSYDVALVTYNERYNDLEKFDYVAPTPRSGSKRGSLVDQQLKHIHPCAMLTVRQLAQAPTFPAHVSLSPREGLALYDAMIKAWPEKDTLQCLCPENYFKDVAFISKPNARSYEAALKTEFMTWIIDRKRMEKVIVHLGGKITSLSGPKARVTGNEFVVQEFYCLLQELDKSGKLPAIFFIYDRSLCEELTSCTVINLFKKEESLQTGSSAHHKAKSQEKQARQVAKREKRSRDNVEEEAHNKQSCFLFDNPPNESCSFAGAGVMDAEDAQAIVRKLEWKGVQEDTPLSLFKEGLRRGVSYHHSGMPAWQRKIVEILFRKKFLRVIFATGTLALGIHMPCKTVVFAGDSVYLNTLQYHQISGRAGRRGFDLLGDVIFLGIPHAKIQRLMTVNLPRIIGNFPLNVTLVLRLLLLVNKVKNREAAMNQVLTLLQNPLICMDQPELDLQLKHHFLFSVELLVRQGLLDRKGNPQGLAGLATHLHYHEPSNLVLVAFLKEGLLHEFCKRGQSKDGFSKDFLISLVTLLSHLFTRVRLHRYILRRKRSTSKVKLEDLSPTFKDGLTKYNNKVREVFDLYLRAVAAHVYDTMGEDVTLPLSQTKFILSESDAAASVSSESGPTVEEKLQDLSLPYKACSAFAALSGNTDNRLYNSEDLISNIRYQVYTDIKVVPVLQTDVTLNAYAVDFFNHGNYKALVSENGLMHGEVFSLLKDFLLVIKSIHVSLVDLAPEDGDAVIAAFAQLSKEYTELFNKAFNIYD